MRYILARVGCLESVGRPDDSFVGTVADALEVPHAVPYGDSDHPLEKFPRLSPVFHGIVEQKGGVTYATLKNAAAQIDLLTPDAEYDDRVGLFCAMAAAVGKRFTGDKYDPKAVVTRLRAPSSQRFYVPITQNPTEFSGLQWPSPYRGDIVFARPIADLYRALDNLDLPK